MERVYQLDKAHGFDGAGTPEAKQFTAERIAAGASMLRDLIYSAWIESAQPVPQPHPPVTMTTVNPVQARPAIGQ